MKKLFTGLLLALSCMLTAQKAPAKINQPVYDYQTFGCDVQGYFDPGQYKKEEIDGTYKLLYPLASSPFSTLTVFNPKKLDLIRSNYTHLLQQAEKEYVDRKKELNGLKFIDLPIWKQQYEESIRLLESEYQLRKELLMGYSDPQSLRNSKFYNTCAGYVDAITTSDKQKMYSVWKSLAESQSTGTRDTFNAKWNDQQKDDYALIDLMNAFHNCANHSFRPTTDDDALFQTFEKIFTKLKRDCDEP